MEIYYLYEIKYYDTQKVTIITKKIEKENGTAMRSITFERFQLINPNQIYFMSKKGGNIISKHRYFMFKKYILTPMN